MQIVRWQEQSLPQEQELRKRMQQAGLSPYAWSNDPGDYYAAHTHKYEKVLYCVRGSIRFILHNYADESGSDTCVDLAAGDCMYLPMGIQHSARVGPQGVTCLEASRT